MIKFTKNINNNDFSDDTAKIAIIETAEKFVSQAVVLAPVDTGRLRDSIQEQPANDGSYDYLVGTNVEYAAHQEFGTKYQPAQAFLRPAAYLMKNSKISQDEFNQYLAGIGSK